MSLGGARAWTTLGQGLSNIGDYAVGEQDRERKQALEDQARTLAMSKLRDEQLSLPGASTVESYVQEHPDNISQNALADIGNAAKPNVPLSFNAPPPETTTSLGPGPKVATVGGAAMSIPEPITTKVQEPAPYMMTSGVVMDPTIAKNEIYSSKIEDAKIKNMTGPYEPHSFEAWQAQHQLESDLRTKGDIDVANATGVTDRNRALGALDTTKSLREQMPPGLQMLEMQVKNAGDAARMVEQQLKAGLMDPDEANVRLVNSPEWKQYQQLQSLYRQESGTWAAQHGMPMPESRSPFVRTDVPRPTSSPLPFNVGGLNNIGNMALPGGQNPTVPEPSAPMSGPPPGSNPGIEPIAPAAALRGPKPPPPPGSAADTGIPAPQGPSGPPGVSGPSPMSGPIPEPGPSGPPGAPPMSAPPVPGGPGPSAPPAPTPTPTPAGPVAAKAPAAPPPDLVAKARAVKQQHPTWTPEQRAAELRRLSQGGK